MATIGPDFVHGRWGVVGKKRYSPHSMFGGVIRAGRTGASAIRSFAGSLKESWNAAELRSAMIERRMNDMKRQQDSLHFGCPRIF